MARATTTSVSTIVTDVVRAAAEELVVLLLEPVLELLEPWLVVCAAVDLCVTLSHFADAPLQLATSGLITSWYSCTPSIVHSFVHTASISEIMFWQALEAQKAVRRVSLVQIEAEMLATEKLATASHSST